MTIESYKTKSKIATAIGGIATIISVLGVEQLNSLFPGYGQFIPAIVALATWYLSQTTENKRVEVAEQLVHEQYNDPTPEINPEYEVGSMENEINDIQTEPEFEDDDCT